MKVNTLLPRMLVFLVYVTGILLLFSSSIIERVSEYRMLETVFPAAIVEVSHFVTSLIGLVLIFLAEGLRKRVDLAYMLTVLLLIVAATLTMLNNFNFLEAVGFLALIALLFLSRRYFHRKSSLLRMDYSIRWVLLSVFVLASFMALGFFLYRYVDYSDELWWRFEFDAGAPRFLRILVGVFVLLLIFLLSRILKLAPLKFRPTTEEEWNRLRKVLDNNSRYSAKLALLGDKSFVFSKSSKAFLMYGVYGRSWVAMGDPVGPQEEWKEVILEFRRAAAVYDGWPVFFEIGKENLSLYLDLGFNLFKIGEEARLFLPEFNLDRPAFYDLRKALKKIMDKGFTFEILDPPQSTEFFASLRSVSDAWLRSKHVGEKRFSLGSFREDYLKNFPIAVVRQNNEVFAFADLWLNSDKSEFSADLIRFRPEGAPNGIMDYLFTNLILWGKGNPNFQWFNLGMAPLSGIEHHEFVPIWLKLGDLVYRHGEHFYNFQGLRQYKEKFCPVWEPKYIASLGSLALPKILADISLLISGGYRGILFGSAPLHK